jgi:hypothetical protein
MALLPIHIKAQGGNMRSRVRELHIAPFVGCLLFLLAQLDIFAMR